LENEDKINYKRLTLGALCMALAVACRPNYLLISLIFLPKFIKILIIKIKSKRDILKYILAVGLPYLIIGILLMIYNYIRFDNVFEFGIRYQLTVNDMRNLGYRILAVPSGIITQLFQSPIATTQFPFFQYQYKTIIFFGYYFVGAMECGLFLLNPINFILFLLIGLKNKIKEKKAYNFICTLTIVSILICLVDILLGGSVQRYSADYAWILNIASYLTLFMLVSNIRSKEIKKYIMVFAILITIYMLIVNFIVGGVEAEYNILKIKYPEQYYSIRYGICFWE